MTLYGHALSPFRFGGVEVKNRIATPPMLSCLATPEGFVTREMIDFYQSFARGGAGMVNIGDTAVDDEYGKGHHMQLSLGDDRVIGGLSTLVEAIEKYGGVASVEINHTGMLGSPAVLGRNPIGPSAGMSSHAGFAAKPAESEMITITEMDQALIDRVVENFATACSRCVKAGFRTVMLHGGHGNLLAQFASSRTNRRTDKYGGDLENRARFALEVLDAIRGEVGDALALEYRVSADEIVPDGMHEDETIEFLRLIRDRIDLVHVSVGMISDPAAITSMAQPTYLRHGFNVYRAEKIKREVGLPVTAVGSISDLAMADQIIATGRADMVAMGRAHIAEPEIVRKSSRGELGEVRPCVRCNRCGEHAVFFASTRCSVNPVAGRETEYKNIPSADRTKKVVVVGGGPGGMQAALTASARGHDVTLFEKADALGGSLRYAVAPDFKADLRRYLFWLVEKTSRSVADVRLQTAATPESVAALKPDVVIVAVGAEPFVPDIPGIRGDTVVWAGDVDTGAVETGDTVVVAGAGLTGCETAVHLAKQGKAVTLIDTLPEERIAADASMVTKLALLDLLEQHGVVLKTEVTLTEVTANSAVVTDARGERIELPAGTVVLALGMCPLEEAVQAFRSSAPETYVIGDCRRPRSLFAAIHEGFDVTAEL